MPHDDNARPEAGQLKQCQQCGKSFKPRTNSKGIFCSQECKADFRFPGRPSRITGERSDCPVFIYSLTDPFTGNVRYIGQSTHPKERLAAHCNEKSCCHRANWIKSVIRRGKRPLMEILEEIAPDADWQAAERWWIAHGRERGWPLTNGTDGGDGVPGLSPEIRQRIVAASTGRIPGPETRAKIGRSSRGRKHTDDHKKRMSLIMKDRVITWGDKLSRASRKLSDDQVREVRTLLASNMKSGKVAKKMGVHRDTITNIKFGRFYNDVT